MMTNKVSEIIQNRIIFDSALLRSAVTSSLLGGIIAIIVLMFGLNLGFKRSYATKKMQHIIKASCLTLLLLYVAAQLFWYEGKRFEQLIHLKRDFKEQTVYTSSGVVDRIFGFEKGGNAAIINDQVYYIMPVLGRMETGAAYQFDYLETSRFIVSFEMQRDGPSPNEVEISYPKSKLVNTEIENGKVYFYCILTAINHSQYDKKVTFTAKSLGDFKRRLLQDKYLYGVEWEDDDNSILDNNEFILPGNSTTDNIHVVFIGKHGSSNTKHDKKVPSIITIHEFPSEQ